MSELEDHIKRINGKLQQLLRAHQQLQSENGQLRKQVQDKSSKEITLQAKIDELEQKVNILKASTGQMEAKDKVALEKNINRHLKEIDRCITLLSE